MTPSALSATSRSHGSETSDAPFEHPRLQTSRLILRPWKQADVLDMYEYASDPEVTRYAMWPRMSEPDEAQSTIAEMQERYSTGTLYWGLEHKADHKFIGSIGFPVYRKTDRNVEVGYALHRTYWGRGLMSEALERVIRYAWDVLELHRIEAKVISANTDSIQLLQKFSFHLEGIRREAALIDGEFLDVFMYGLLHPSARV